MSRTVGAMCTTEVLSIFSGTLQKRVPNPVSFLILEQNTASFIASAAATSSAVSPCSPTLELTAAFKGKTKYNNADLPSPGLFPQFASENEVNLKLPCLYAMVESTVGQVVKQMYLVCPSPCELRAVETSPSPTG